MTHLPVTTLHDYEALEAVGVLGLKKKSLRG